MNTRVVLKLWVLKYTGRSDQVGYSLDRSGFSNVSLGNLKWLEFSPETRIQREIHKNITRDGTTQTWGRSSLTYLGRNDCNSSY